MTSIIYAGWPKKLKKQNSKTHYSIFISYDKSVFRKSLFVWQQMIYFAGRNNLEKRKIILQFNNVETKLLGRISSKYVVSKYVHILKH